MTQRPILIMAGGTGGHIFPALAVADKIRAAGCPVAWLGTRAGLEAKLVPSAGIPMYWIKVRGLRGKGILQLVMSPLMLLWAFAQAAWIMIKLRPSAVLGMGGYATGPGGVMAWLLRRPLLIHEQNSVAGLTNRWLARVANTVLEAFPKSLPNAIHTGNPVRDAIASIPLRQAAMQSRKPRLLVVGGSLGAAVLNEQVPKALASEATDDRPEVLHQTGLKHLDSANKHYQDAGVDVQLEAFIEDMAAAYQWADLVLCRSGALTVAELAAAGVASILVPYPHAVDDHQTTNAAYLVDVGAAKLQQQSEMTVERLQEQLKLLQQPLQLQKMAIKARSMARPDAAQQVADYCLQASQWRGAA